MGDDTLLRRRRAEFATLKYRFALATTGDLYQRGSQLSRQVRQRGGEWGGGLPSPAD